MLDGLRLWAGLLLKLPEFQARKVLHGIETW